MFRDSAGLLVKLARVLAHDLILPRDVSDAGDQRPEIGRATGPALNATVVGCFGCPLFSEYEPVLQIFEVTGAGFLDRDRVATEFALLGGVTQQDFRLAPGFLRGPNRSAWIASKS